jgi:hypothetical protein
MAMGLLLVLAVGLRALLAAPPAAASDRPLLYVGSRGAAVVALQHSLTRVHYDVGPVDGIFGYNTYHGVVAFQKVNGLERDGIVGPKTRRALRHPVQPRARHGTASWAVEIDLTRQVLYLTRNGAISRILDASTGSGRRYRHERSWHRALTPTGAFRIARRIDHWHRSSLGRLYRPSYFHYGYAIHGSTSVPAYPASHGCVRVTLPVMDRMWSKISVGMPVWIYRS